MSNRSGLELEALKCAYSTFSSSDVTRIAGIPGQIQRLWRSRGYISKGSAAKPTFSTLEAAELLVRYDLSKFGVPPSESKQAGETAAKILLLYALLNSDGTCEVIGKQAQVSQFLENFEEDADLAFRLCDGPDLHRFLFRTSSADIVFVDSLESAVTDFRLRAGAFLDLEQAATEFSTRARGPLISINLCQGAEPETRRLTGQRPPRLRLVAATQQV